MIKRTLIFTLLLAPLVTIVGPDISVQAQSTSQIAEALQPLYQRAKERSAFEKKVAEESYQVTSNLCFLFEFRKKHELPLLTSMLTPTPRADLITGTKWLNDTHLRDSLLAWVALSFENVKSTWGPNSDSFERLAIIARYPGILMQAEGYRKAASECSIRLGESADTLMRREIQYRQLQAKVYSVIWISAASTIAAKVAISLGAGRIIMALGSRAGFSERSVKIAGYSFAGSASMGAIAASLLDIIEVNEAFIDDSVKLTLGDTEPMQILNPKDVDVMLMMRDLARIKELAEQANLANASGQGTDAAAGQRLRIEIAALSRKISEVGLDVKSIRVRADYFDHLLVSNLANPEHELAIILNRSARGEKLNDDEAEVLNWARIRYAYRLAEQLTSLHQPR